MLRATVNNEHCYWCWLPLIGLPWLASQGVLFRLVVCQTFCMDLNYFARLDAACFPGFTPVGLLRPSALRPSTLPLSKIKSLQTWPLWNELNIVWNQSDLFKPKYACWTNNWLFEIFNSAVDQFVSARWPHGPCRGLFSVFWLTGNRQPRAYPVLEYSACKTLTWHNCFTDTLDCTDALVCSRLIVNSSKQESPAVADKPARRLRKVCTVYVRAVGL